MTEALANTIATSPFAALGLSTTVVRVALHTPAFARSS
jgi:hypothetical protein